MKAISAIFVFVVVSSCVDVGGKIADSPNADARVVGVDAGPKATSMPVNGDVATLLAKIERMETRFVNLSKEIETKTHGELKATRDAVQTTKNVSGMGEWPQVATTACFCFLMGYQSRCRMREALAKNCQRSVT